MVGNPNLLSENGICGILVDTNNDDLNGLGVLLVVVDLLLLLLSAVLVEVAFAGSLGGGGTAAGVTAGVLV